MGSFDRHLKPAADRSLAGNTRIFGIRVVLRDVFPFKSKQNSDPPQSSFDLSTGWLDIIKQAQETQELLGQWTRFKLAAASHKALKPFRLQCFHNGSGGEGVVGGIADLYKLSLQSQ